VTERLLRTRDVAELLDVSSETVLRWHRSGKLPGGRRLGSNVLRFNRGELDEWLEMHRADPRVAGGIRPAEDL
jgi:excisionase family DNA binding protein